MVGKAEAAHLTSAEIWHAILYGVGIVQLMILYIILKKDVEEAHAVS